MFRGRPLLGRLAPAAIFAVLLSLYIGLAGALSQRNVQTDFAKFYASARLAIQGGDIYAPVRVDEFGPIPNRENVTGQFQHANLSLPAATLLLCPLGFLSYQRAFHVWSLLSLAAGLLAMIVVFCVGFQPPRRPAGLLWLWIALLAYYPTFASVQLGQMTLVLVLLTVVAWSAARSGHHALAGVALGIASTLKIFAGFLVVFFLVRRQWRVAAWSAIAFLTGALAALLVMGPGVYQRYARAIASVTWYASNWNASFLGFTSRFLGGSDHTPLVNLPGLARLLAGLLSLATVACVLWISQPRTDEHGTARFDLTYGLSMAGMLLISPLGWMYYFPLLLLPVVLAWQTTAESPARRARALLALGWLLSTAPIPLVPSESLNDPVSWLTWASVSFYALLVLTGVTAWLAAGRPRVADYVRHGEAP